MVSVGDAEIICGTFSWSAHLGDKFVLFSLTSLVIIGHRTTLEIYMVLAFINIPGGKVTRDKMDMNAPPPCYLMPLFLPAPSQKP